MSQIGIGPVAQNMESWWYAEGEAPYTRPEWYGAVRDGVTDDSVAINAAIATGKEVRFSNGTYAIGSTIVLSPYFASLKGQMKRLSSFGGTIVEEGSRLLWIGGAGGPMISSGNGYLRGLIIDELTLDGNLKDATVGLDLDGSAASNAQNVKLSKLIITGCDLGCSIGENFSVSEIDFYGCRFELNTKQLRVDDVNCYNITLNSCNFYGDANTTHILDCVNGKVHFYRCYLGGLANANSYVAYLTGANSIVSFDSCYGDGIDGAYVYYASAMSGNLGLSMINCWFAQGAGPAGHGTIYITNAVANPKISIISSYVPQGLEVASSNTPYGAIINSDVGTISGTYSNKLMYIGNYSNNPSLKVPSNIEVGGTPAALPLSQTWLPSGWNVAGKMGFFHAGNIFQITYNCIPISAAQVNLVDTGEGGVVISLSNGVAKLETATAGVNPRNLAGLAWT